MFLHHWELEFSKLYHDITSCSQNYICQQLPAATLRSQGFLCNHATVSDPNQSLLNKHSLPAPIIILVSNYNLVIFAFTTLPTPKFAVPDGTQLKCFWICISWVIALSLARMKYFSILIIFSFTDYFHPQFVHLFVVVKFYHISLKTSHMKWSFSLPKGLAYNPFQRLLIGNF